MKELIEGLQILAKYDSPDFPTHCEHDVMWILVDPALVTEADIEKLDNMGFVVDNSDQCFKSYKYGSA